MENDYFMCTVSWLHTPDGYHLLCNRDELHTRKRASVPSIQQRQCIRFIAPADGDHGGSWIAVNEFGLTFCLLNRYGCGARYGETKARYQSRGLLVMSLVDCQSLVEVRTRINQFELEEFQPFTLAVLAIAQPALLCDWTGHDLLLECHGEYTVPLTSSSFDEKGVEVCRKRLFKTLVTEREHLDVQLLLNFHRSHLPVRSAYSPCMHREDAATVSFSWVTVARDSIQFSYLPGAPCSQEPPGAQPSLPSSATATKDGCAPGHFHSECHPQGNMNFQAGLEPILISLAIRSTSREVRKRHADSQ
jgi:hypothetical protein